MERAAGREVDDRRRRALDRAQVRDLGLDARHRLEQAPRVRVLRLGEDLGGRAVLDRAAGVHDHDRLRGLGDDAEVVRDQDHADVEVALDLVDQLEDLRLDGHVERRRRLVGDQHGRVVDERHRDHGALAHAAGELVRIVLGTRPRVRDADGVEHLDRALERVRLGDVEMRAHGLSDLAADAIHRVQARERILEDHRDVLAAHVAQLVRRRLEQVLALEQDLARDLRPLGVQQAEDGEVRDALARARLADDAERLAAPERERQARDRVDDAVLGRELDGQVADVEKQLAAHEYRTLGSRKA